MKIEIDFNDSEKSGIKKAFLLQVAKKTLAQKDFAFLKNKNISISFAMVTEKEITRLNAIYRRKKTATDVLSFCEYKNQKELNEAGDKNVYLGEVIACYNYIAKYAKQEKKNVKQELAEIITHGVLHLLGFRHSKKMFAIQKEVSNKYYGSE
ncbi:MAG: rRNA maturation RNase YbeY [Candidatus Moranbacteria bacterium CG23_combo_of_CG06-09_8_20_14_all_35_22]|nr:MAG: rRNA maturation RNase YbeY [Candidatus Moranbacteria bacterium CG23_combo_of_CG06-09_8_20_14_all_35_22]